VIAVEKDKELADFLAQKFTEEIKNKKLELIFCDILNLEAELPSRYKLIANIPYYITSRFLRIFLESREQPSLMVLMVQKEVAERIMGRKVGVKQNFLRSTLPRSLPAGKAGAAGSDASQNFALPLPSTTKESLLSISVKAYGRPEIIRYVPAGYFSPAPKVDSAVIKISGISKKFFKDIGEKKFFEIVKKGFSQKRKMLINNLKVQKSDFTACNIDKKARAENLSLAQWKCLAANIKISL
jgi:16S rRNA (adenine1518-N6/adenine1519-N6)-dimethyltransferase